MKKSQAISYFLPRCEYVCVCGGGGVSGAEGKRVFRVIFKLPEGSPVAPVSGCFTSNGPDFILSSILLHPSYFRFFYPSTIFQNSTRPKEKNSGAREKDGGI